MSMGDKFQRHMEKQKQKRYAALSKKEENDDEEGGLLSPDQEDDRGSTDLSHYANVGGKESGTEEETS
jgi:hypothetical protein